MSIVCSALARAGASLEYLDLSDHQVRNRKQLDRTCAALRKLFDGRVSQPLTVRLHGLRMNRDDLRAWMEALSPPVGAAFTVRLIDVNPSVKFAEELAGAV